MTYRIYDFEMKQSYVTDDEMDAYEKSFELDRYDVEEVEK